MARGMAAIGRGRPSVRVAHDWPPSSLLQNAESPPSGRRQPPGPTPVTELNSTPGREARVTSGAGVYARPCNPTFAGAHVSPESVLRIQPSFDPRTSVDGSPGTKRRV